MDRQDSLAARPALRIGFSPIDIGGQGISIWCLTRVVEHACRGCTMTSPFVEILVTKLDAELLRDVLPMSDERRKLSEKIRACEIALNFLHYAEDEAGRFSGEFKRGGNRAEVIALPLYPS